MKKSKNLAKILIPLVILAAAVILIIVFVRPAKNNANPESAKLLENSPIKEAKAQSYATTRTPALKADDKVIGSKDAKLKIFVYEDSSSIYSAKLADTLDKLYSDMPSQLAIVVRPFTSKGSNVAKEAALGVECAGEQNKWVQMRALLFAQVKSDSLNLSDFSKYIEQLGLDAKAFLACLTNSTKSAKIEELSREAEGYNVQGAPTIFIGDEMILGARPYGDYVDSNGDSIEGLKTLIEKKIK